jgi:hypothetical protein
MKNKVIVLDEALRMLIRIRDPALADRVRSIEDVGRLRNETLPGYREADRVIYDESLEALCAAVRELIPPQESGSHQQSTTTG